MQGELFYGNDGLLNWDDSNASGQSYTSAFGGKENEQIEETKEHLDITNSNTRLDKFLFYYSSKL